MDPLKLKVADVISNESVDGPISADGLIELRDLIALGQIGVEVVLSGKGAFLMDCASKSESRADSQGDRLTIEGR